MGFSPACHDCRVLGPSPLLLLLLLLLEFAIPCLRRLLWSAKLPSTLSCWSGRITPLAGNVEAQWRQGWDSSMTAEKRSAEFLVWSNTNCLVNTEDRACSVSYRKQSFHWQRMKEREEDEGGPWVPHLNPKQGKGISGSTTLGQW